MNQERFYPDDLSFSEETERHHRTRYLYAASQAHELGPALDVACGSGYGSQFLYDTGFRPVHGVDVSTEAIDFAKNHFSNPEFFIENLETYTPPRNDYSLITFFEAIEHVSREIGIQTVKRCADALSEGGVFCLSTPRDIKADENPFHITQWTVPELKEALTPLFSEVTILGQDWSTGVISNNLTTHNAFYFAVCRR